MRIQKKNQQVFDCIVILSITCIVVVIVAVGDLDLATNYEGEEKIAQQRKITKITKHPKYISGRGYFDVAVLEIEEVWLSETVRTICLPDSTDFKEDKYDLVTTYFVRICFSF